ncbi:MAG: Glycosyl transferase group 1 [candidate division CPR2 bacterium GW2011_GWC1_39_9]|uniref:Glycosyl transferase group 1 n=1 Tax=candidate division CPR2 bacterium GW2011_GWC2_39_10 TaxID=1618345 RepID=A0A0G0LVP8_UNCC2|nr:MAG: Glycosyl transferase group 1 [candidate division CPR2 bacterium GW2011_GWC2_39_10]KKR35978.1 MAG: Glycosyl transferase group 1 [candidate division CPR2 bacterium GW2011_GWC1_39_9]
MKICIIAPTVIPILGRKQEYGGIELVVALAAEELTRRGHDVYLFAPGDSHVSCNLVSITPSAVGQGISFEKEKHFNKIAYEMAVAENPDIIWDNTLAVHAQEMGENHSIFLFKADIAINREEMVNTGDIPVIQTLHGPAKDHIPGLIKTLGEAGQFFVSISHDQAKRFAPYIERGQHLGTVYNAVDTEFYHINPNKKGDFLLWLGRFCMEKGTHIALEVAHKLDMPIKIVGKIAEKHEKDYFEKFIKPNLRSKDEVLGIISSEMKKDLYADAYATLMSNIWPEPFGLVAIESMASGTPVVGPSLGSLTEVVNGSGVLVPVEDLHLNENETYITDAQLKYINRMAEYVPKAKAIPPELPRDRVEKLFSVKHNADGYETSFAKAIYLKKKELKALV